MDVYTEVILQLNGKQEADAEALKEVVTSYFKLQQIQINNIIKKTMTDDDFADIMDKYTLSEIKSVLTTVSQIQAMLDSQETIN